MGKITETRKLYKETLKELTKTEENWLSFLDSSSWNFKYDFADQILIYAQRPEATACADIETWNNKVKRWINKNANGIFIFDNNENSQYPFKLVFDVSDTHNYKGTPYKLWSVEEKYQMDIIESLDATFVAATNGPDGQPGGGDDTAASMDAVLHLATGVNYTEKDIENILKEAGYDYSVKLTDSAEPDGDKDGSIRFNVKDTTGVEITMANGAGVGKEVTPSSGKGLTFQIGANGVEDQRVTLNVNDMSSSAIGVANADVSTQDAANKAIEMVDKAVKTVSMQRAGLGALQNRLEYTVNNLTTTNENLTAAESQIRDTDMATEMISYTKYNILQQASQAMLAQANQQPQAVLQLLQ